MLDASINTENSIRNKYSGKYPQDNQRSFYLKSKSQFSCQQYQYPTTNI